MDTSAQPRSFERNAVFNINSDDYGFNYSYNKTAWMTTVIFEEYLDWFNALMVKEERHILLLVDNFSGHNVASRPNIELRFLPPNCTAKAQPCDAGIIKCLKDEYKKFLYKRVFTNMQYVSNVESFVKGLTIFDAVDWLVEAWKLVKPSNIVNCFHKCKIVDELWMDVPVEEPSETELIRISQFAENVVGFDDDEIEAQFLEMVEEMVTLNSTPPTLSVGNSKSKHSEVAASGWWQSSLDIQWVESTFNENDQGSYLFRDHAPARLSYESQALLESKGMEQIFIPKGLTGKYQLLDVGVNYPFKCYLKQSCHHWRDNCTEITKKGYEREVIELAG
ncbi:hypothetical protein RvY_15331 [Ramazzottius varieornatus]|uniref:DDE-1 domain-containing protein n=1 Tax=Ramazzottius varieornatus TaxID=947166 RepID=A0A1D1W2K7_RAMVA|nr:hypothetical protein RvY_15331 [Ramazzottius varieornatus]